MTNEDTAKQSLSSPQPKAEDEFEKRRKKIGCKNCQHEIWKSNKWSHKSEMGNGRKLVCGESNCNCTKPEPYAEDE